jgi:hypothetical protein
MRARRPRAWGVATAEAFDRHNFCRRKTSAGGPRGEALARAQGVFGATSFQFVCVCVCVVAGSAAADTIPRRLADYRFANDSWDIRPAYEPATGLVTGIVAVAKPDAVIGDNLSVVMFKRTIGNQWSAWSWGGGATRAEGVMGAKYQLNIPDEDDPTWEIDEPLALFNGEDWLIPPSPYMAGMLTDDPLFEPVMNSSNPAALVSMLADLGYPVATAGRPLEGGGESDCVGEEEVPMLMAMASGVEWEMTQPIGSATDLIAASESILNQLPGPCVSQTAPTCTPKTTLTTGGSKRCIWIKEATDVDENGNILFCNYRARVVFVETETHTTINADCTITRCTRSRSGHLDGNQVNCQPSMTPGGVTHCPTAPSCYASPPTQTVCSTLATSPLITWTAWTKPCP